MTDAIPLPLTPPVDDGRVRVTLVTGPSGAGRSTAVRALEDLGWEVIDNLPLSLLPRLIDGPPLTRPLALGLDVRNRGFGTDALIEAIDGLAQRPDIAEQVLYLDADEDTLVRRYSETRRRHPLAQSETPEIGIAREIELLQPIEERADILIDTSNLSPHDLKAELLSVYDINEAAGLSVSVQSFSYKRGVPRGLDMVLDVRFLRNPHWDAGLRAMTGKDQEVSDYIEQDPRYEPFFVKIRDLIEFLLPAYGEEGKSHLAIGFGCTGGRHRSVALTETLAKALADKGWQVSIRHRELERLADQGARRGT